MAEWNTAPSQAEWRNAPAQGSGMPTVRKETGGRDPQPREPRWDGLDAFVDGWLWGQGPKAAGMLARLSGKDAEAYEAGAEKARAAYREREGGASAIPEIAGSTITSLGPIGLINRGLSTIPHAGRFLIGRGGYGPQGNALNPSWTTWKGWGSRGTRVGSQATSGAIEGAATAALTNQLTDQNLLDDLEGGAVFGGGLKAALGPTANAILNTIRGPVISRERALSAKRMLDADIPLRGTQVIEAGPYEPKQVGALGRAIARTMGEDLPEGEMLTHPVLERIRKRIGTVFEGAARDNGVRVDQELLNKLDAVQRRITAAGLRNDERGLIEEIEHIRRAGGATWDEEAGRWVAPPETAVYRVRDTVGRPSTSREVGEPREIPPGPARGPEDLERLPNEGGPERLSGEWYNIQTEYGSPLSELERHSRGTVKHFASEIREAMDDALERHSPEASIQAIRDARKWYKNLKVFEPLAQKSGSDGVAFNPRTLPTRVNRVYKNAREDTLEDSDIHDLGTGVTDFFAGPYRDAPLGMRTFTREGMKNALKDMVPGGMAAAMTVPSHPLAAPLVGATVAGGLMANRAYRESPRYANALVQRALAPERAMSLMPWSELPLVVGTEIYNR